jgi:hypothetical protein
MLVLARVCASTFLTMTAQYRLYLPSAEGRLPLTTTEPGRDAAVHHFAGGAVVDLGALADVDAHRDDEFRRR